MVLLSIAALVALPAIAGATPSPTPRATGPLVEVMVVLDEPALAQASGARTLAAHGASKRRLDLTTPASASYLRRIAATQRTLESRLTDVVPQATVRRRYSVVLDAVSVVLPSGAVGTLQDIPGVARVYPSYSYSSLRSASPEFIGAPSLWGRGLTSAGNGIKIGIIDDGVDASHPYFKPRGFRMPRGYPRGQRKLATAKVIVAKAFAPRRLKWRYANRAFDPKLSEHATHVAGIAAGNYRTTSIGGERISGVAPKAYIGSYKVLSVPTSGFGLNGNSPEIVAGIEAAVRDGMDVINLSIGEAEVEPDRDIVARALDGAAAAGVVPVVAAGNSFSELGFGSVGSPANSARAISVAAETEFGPVVASFSSAGPTPLSLLMKPDITAPGVSVLSSVPRRAGLWQPFSGTSMAAPHVAGAAALLRQRHRGWTVEQIKSALVQTGDAVYTRSSGSTETASIREGGGTVNLVRADTPLLFASPTGLSFGLVRPGTTVPRAVQLADAGGGAGDWSVAVNAQQAPGGATVTAPLQATVPGELAVSVVTVPGAAQADHTGFLVLTRGADRRRIPYWFRVADPALAGMQATPLPRTGTYRGNTRGRPALIDSYRYPDDPSELGLPRFLRGPEQVFRVSLPRRVANFGVAVTSERSDIEPRVMRAGDENRLLGEVGLPFIGNPYLEDFGRPAPIAGAILPSPGDYDIVFDSETAAGAGSFTFRFWIGDSAPPKLRLVSARGGQLRISATDRGAGIDPSTLVMSVDGRWHAARYDARRGRVTASIRGLPRGRHRVVVLVSDYQESKNMENVPKILPNTARLAAPFIVR